MYREVTFHVFEEDFVPGLTVVWLQTPEGLIPYTWGQEKCHGAFLRDFRPATFSNREDSSVVDTEVYGGTMEQFLHAREVSRAYQEIHGRELGAYVHFPRSKHI